MSHWHPMGSAEFIDQFPLYRVSSAGATDDVAALTVTAILQTVPFLERLSLDLGHRKLPLVPAEHFAVNAASQAAATSLKALFDAHGSDKANSHNYHHVYGSILQQPELVTGVFEIGLGTHHTDVVSNMGVHGRPGSSLRAFRDFLPNAQIYGADVDRRVLFTEDRIQTFFLDQTDLGAIDTLSGQLDRQFDLVIDDGLHSPNANVAALVFGLRHVKPGGYFVVEDIAPSHFPVWQVVSALLPANYQCTLVAAHAGCMCVMRKAVLPS